VTRNERVYLRGERLIEIETKSLQEEVGYDVRCIVLFGREGAVYDVSYSTKYGPRSLFNLFFDGDSEGKDE